MTEDVGGQRSHRHETRTNLKEGVRAIKDCERLSRSNVHDTGQGPTSERMPEEFVLTLLEERQIPIETSRKALASIKIGVAVIKLRIERIKQTEVEVVAGIAERRTQVVPRKGIGVTRRELQPEVAQVAAFQRGNQSVVIRVALVTTRVEWIKVGVEQLKRIRAAKGACRPTKEARQAGTVIVAEVVKLASC